MNHIISRKGSLLLLPLLLLISTALIFFLFSQWLGKELGYILGFIFYWAVWCIMVPILLLGKSNFLSLFRGEVPLFQKKNWLPITLLLATTVGAFLMFFLPNITTTPLAIIMIGIPVAIINGTCEEIFWRGLFVKKFPNRPLLGMIYPTVGFALWHLSPQIVFPSEGGLVGIVIFIVSTFFLGFCYAWVSFRTNSIKWNAFSHSLNSILAFGMPISTSLFKLIFS
ncbi:MAG: CPBP family intramembrane glutamic endopeptidase [Promethearchaeota archaeon]